MIFEVKFTLKAEKQLKKLTKPEQKQIIDFIKNHIKKLDDPKKLGKALTGNLKKFWRYRTGDYRIICEIIESSMLLVLVIAVGNRKLIYKKLRTIDNNTEKEASKIIDGDLA
ncbi:MAG: type II toxin-antitoxin system RelE/ParE family toxin [Gammaproteobacteria bacterium]